MIESLVQCRIDREEFLGEEGRGGEKNSLSY